MKSIPAIPFSYLALLAILNLGQLHSAESDYLEQFGSELKAYEKQGDPGKRIKDAVKLYDVTRHDNHVKSGELDFTIKSGNLEREPVGI